MMFGQEGYFDIIKGWLPETPVISTGLPLPTGSAGTTGTTILESAIKGIGDILTLKMQYDIVKKQAEAQLALAKAGVVMPSGATATQLLQQQQQQQLLKYVLIGGGALAAVLIVMKARKGGKK